jgi:hypothetical protein
MINWSFGHQFQHVMLKKIIKEFITKKLELMEIRLINNNISVIIIIVTILLYNYIMRIGIKTH